MQIIKQCAAQIVVIATTSVAILNGNLSALQDAEVGSRFRRPEALEELANRLWASRHAGMTLRVFGRRARFFFF